MIIYPAIDLRNGLCVRLYQGNYDAETVYSNSPYEKAKEFAEQGANWLHLVDLDGAKDPNFNQAPLIQELLRQTPINIQVGGGIRTQSQIEAYFLAGAIRVVIGSLAVEAPQLVSSWLKQYGSERLVLALDVSFEQGFPSVRTQAWQKTSDLALFDLIENYADLGAQHFLCTDISRDGALQGPNLDLYQQMIHKFPTLDIQASGGISCLDDIRQLKQSDLAGAVMGKALYEKKFALKEALAC